MEIKLSNGNSSAVILSHGAELKSLIIGGRELIWQTDGKYWNKSSPVLFPMIGNLRDGKTVIENKEVNISKHGFMRDREFTVHARGDSDAVMYCTYNPTAGEYPFKCQLGITYHLTPSALEIGYLVNNLDKGTIYYCIGAHPALACGNLDNCEIRFEKREKAATPVKNADGLFEDGRRIERLNNAMRLSLDYGMFDEDVVYFDALRSRKVTFIEGRKTLASIAFDGFETLGLWTPAGKRAPFLCIEPWCGCDDYDTDDGVFAHKRGIQSLPYKGTKRYKMTISAE